MHFAATKISYYRHTSTDLPTNETMVSTTSDRNNMMTKKDNTITITNSESETVSESCRVTAVTVGVVSAVVTGLLVAVISVAVHIAVYQYFYKPKLMRLSPVVQDGLGQTGDVVVYDVVREREVTVRDPEMRQNEAYGLVKPN